MSDEAKRERRVRQAYLAPELVLSLFRAREKQPSVYVQAVFPGLPDDVGVESVFYCPERRGFMFLLSHPSFDPVPDGEYPPSVSVRCIPVVKDSRDSGGIWTGGTKCVLDDPVLRDDDQSWRDRPSLL